MRYSAWRWLKNASTSWSVTVTWPRNLSAVSATTWSFTFSLRCLYSRSSSGSDTAIQSVRRRAQLVDHHAAAQVLLEVDLGHRRALLAEQLLVTRLADEAAVFLQPRNREDLLRELLVADADALALGLGQRRLLVDHLLQDLLVDAELAQQLLVDVAAVRRLVRLHLREIATLELAGRQRPPLDLSDDLVGRGGAGNGRGRAC